MIQKDLPWSCCLCCFAPFCLSFKALRSSLYKTQRHTHTHFCTADGHVIIYLRAELSHIKVNTRPLCTFASSCTSIPYFSKTLGLSLEKFEETFDGFVGIRERERAKEGYVEAETDRRAINKT